MGEPDGQPPLLPPESFRLKVNRAGRVSLPPAVQEALHLQPGDLFSVRRNTVSVRLDPYGDLLEDLRRSVRVESDCWRYLGQFLQHPQTSVEADGSIEIPPHLLALAPGDRIALELSMESLRPAFYLYRDDA